MTKVHQNILTINSGSSSIKFSLYKMEDREEKVLSGRVEGIRQQNTIFFVQDSTGKILKQQRLTIHNHRHALKTILNWLKSNGFDRKLDAIGHRVVHGGRKYSKPVIVTPGLLKELRKLGPFLPEHLPHEIAAIETAGRSYPRIKQVACFDTAFHRNMPMYAQLYALPRSLIKEGVLRYGFHGISYEYIISQLSREKDRKAAKSRIIIAHLGHGASMVAISNKRALDTTMGFTPAGGLIMSTRTGDLDPGVLIYLMKQKRMTPAQINELVNSKSGIMGISGCSGDMKEILEKAKRQSKAREAVTLFCYHIKKFMGSLIMVLGGLDNLIFTGGIGENSPEIRKLVCDGLKFMNITIDPYKNMKNSPIISRPDSAVTVRVMKTNEELMIARHTYTLIQKTKNKGLS
jgi:acetate kinase